MKRKRNLFFTTLICTAAFLSVNFRITHDHLSLTKKWETEGSLNTPESVIYDPERKIIYVSNLNGKDNDKDGKGFISKLTIEGKIESAEWVKGLDAPKGMGIYNNKLYVTDIDKIVIIDIPSGKIDKKIDVKDAKFLNDLTIDNKGVVYFSDSDTKKIHILKDKKVSVFIESSEFVKPNGLMAQNDGLKYVDMGSGNFYNIGYNDKVLNKIAQNVPAGDGIIEVSSGEYLISNWNGEINYVKGSHVHKVLDTKGENINAADIWYIKEQNLLLVPTFFHNSVAAYTVSK